MAGRVHLQPAAHDALGRGLVALAVRPGARLDPAQDSADAGDEEALAERLGDIVVGAERQAQRLVQLVVLARQEDGGDGALLAQPAEQLMPVHPRHLDVEHGEIGRILGQRLQRRLAIGVEPDGEALGLERDRDRGEDVAIVVDERDRCRHSGSVRPFDGTAIASGAAPQPWRVPRDSV